MDKIDRASKFNQGFITVEYLAGALVDMNLHLAATAKRGIPVPVAQTGGTPPTG